MKKREWLIVILPFLFSWFIDRITKEWATGLQSMESFGAIHFVLHHNHGAMLGLFSDLPTVLRVVSLSTGGAFLLCTYALIQYLLPIKSLTLRTGLSLLIGGIIGNVTDRIIWGYVVDFIVLGTPSISSPAFNLADAIQWLGYVLIVYSIIKEADLLWPEYNIRREYWVNKKFQLKYSFLLIAVGLSSMVICSVFSYTYLRVTIQELVGANIILMNKFLFPYIITFAMMGVAFCAILFAVGKTFSHRIAGPVYAFERFLRSNLNEESNAETQLKLRQGDDFKHLEDLAHEVIAKLNEIKEKRSVNVIEYEDKKTDT